MKYSRLHLGDVTRVRVSVIRDPMPTLISLLADVFGNRPQGVPQAWRELVCRTTPADAPVVLNPMFAPSTAVLPDCISPAVHDRADSAGPADHLERIRDTSPEVLLGELAAFFGEDAPPPWRPVVAAPARWLQRVADVMAGAWDGFTPIWSRASRLFDREFERVGTAVVREAPDAILLSVGSSPRHRYRDGVLYIEDRFPEEFTLGTRALGLIPIVSSSMPSLCDLDQPDRVWLGYAMPDQGQLRNANSGSQRNDALSVAIGPARALILRMLTTPATMSDIAGWIGTTPPAATYHCRQLEDAGLLDRTRSGSHVHVQRTSRGEALVDLFS